VDAVGDWIAFDRYAMVPGTRTALTEKKLVLRGPDFLMRAYAESLRATDKSARLTLQRHRKKKPAALRTLHFGESFVVAAGFTAEHQARTTK
jgi:hypothetical protein